MESRINVCIILKYNKHPRIRKYIFISQPEWVLYRVFSRKSGCSGSFKNN